MRHQLWLGRVLSGLAVLLLLVDSINHLLVTGPVVTTAEQLRFPVSAARGLGVIELVCLVFYLAPRTAVFGAILWTGYLGGALAMQARIGAPLFSTVLLPAYVALLIWGGLWLRNERLRELLPVSQ